MQAFQLQTNSGNRDDLFYVHTTQYMVFFTLETYMYVGMQVYMYVGMQV